MESPRPASDTGPDLRAVAAAFWRIGWLSFGGPAGQIALMHREIVDERAWVGEEEYLEALNLCHLLPGPEAQQLATWIGWHLHGWRGGVVAGLLFVLPGAAVMLGLSLLYVLAADLDWFDGLFLGIKAAVLAIVLQALIRIGRRALGTPTKVSLAIAAFLGLVVFELAFPVLVLGALAFGVAIGRWRPALLGIAPAPRPSPHRPMPFAASARAVALWGAVWAAPLGIVLATLGPDHVLWDVGLFFSKLAVVTFGGAYAVLAYMAQQAVETYGWLAPGEMIDGLGLAETTPGPLIMVTQFTGFLAGWRTPEPFAPLAAGVLGAGLTTWVTFAPCFLWIFALAPWMERLRAAPGIKGGLAAVTAAVVGVIASLAMWFGMHVLFPVAEAGSFALEWRAALLAAVAMVLTFGAKWSVLRVIGLSAAGGLALSLV